MRRSAEKVVVEAALRAHAVARVGGGVLDIGAAMQAAVRLLSLFLGQRFRGEDFGLFRHCRAPRRPAG